MIAKDIKLSEILNLDPEIGFPMFGTQRLIMYGMPAMCNLMKQLSTFVGPKHLARVLSRFGYQIGIKSALEISSMYDFESPQEWLKACKYLGNITGLAKFVNQWKN